MIVLKTERLILRQLRPSDDNALMGVFGDPEVMRFGDGIQTIEWVRDWIQNCISNYYEKKGYGPWGVVHTEDDRIIGYCGLFFFPDVNGKEEIEIGYRFNRTYWGKGYATEAAIGVRDYAFESLNLSRLIAMIEPENIGSIKVAKKIGMAYEQEAWMEGYTHPDHVYAMQNPKLKVENQT